MALPIQLDFFEKCDELALLKAELDLVRESSERVRKGLFARHNDLSKLYMELKEEMDQLKRQIKGKGEILKLEIVK